MFGIGVNEIGGIILLIVLFGIYFIPTGVAVCRKAKRLAGIVVLNILLGWTLIGWVGSLVWAISDNTKEE